MYKMDRKKIAILALVGVLALGGTATAFVTTVNAASQDSPKAMTEEQATEAEAQDENVTLPAGGIDQTTAEQKAQASIPGGVVIASELEDENGTIVYDVEIKTENVVQDVKVDAITGAILKSDQDNDKESKDKENDEQELTAENTKTSITEEQAKQTALVSVRDGVFQSIELEDEDGVIVYGVEIKVGTDTYDIKVDANTGSIVKTDQDGDEDKIGSEGKESKAGDDDNIEHESDSEDSEGHED
ncbi:MAG: PepSY domain-containing protein [Massilibacteroides sp.]|nr:PepSY domain-containing protein [Massilibacteroides sp.]